MPSYFSTSGSQEGTGDLPWGDLVDWAETDLRRQIERSLPPGSPVSASTVIQSALRRAVVRRRDIRHGFRQATVFLASVARKVRREKFRREDAQRRRPDKGTILALGPHDQQLHARSGPDADIWEFVSMLPPHLHDLLYAIYQQDMTLKEFAQQQGLSTKRVERAHHRALHQLRRLLEESA